MSQGKRSHNLCGIRLDCGSEVFQEYGLKYERAFKGWNLLEIDVFGGKKHDIGQVNMAPNALNHVLCQDYCSVDRGFVTLERDLAYITAFLKDTGGATLTEMRGYIFFRVRIMMRNNRG